MEKIPSLITTNGEINPRHDWVLFSPATPTQMHDGIPYAVIKGQPYTHLSSSVLPVTMLLCGISENRFHGWVPVPDDDLIFWSVWDAYDRNNFDWSYELIGPEINGNPEHACERVLVPHGRLILKKPEPTVEGLKAYLASKNIEGLVWWEDVWNPNCRKVKVQQSDFGFKRRNK